MKDALDYLNKLLKVDDTIVLAVSGGPDSMALLNLTIELKKKKNLKLICAHINHNLRKESFEEEKMVKEFCIKNDVIFEYMLIENYDKDNFHNDARNKRYAFFDSLVKKYHAKYLFTAHHADDLMETILMRIVRGSTLKGYAGFKMEDKRLDYTIVRPLVNVTKKDIITYLKSENITFAIDNSNLKDKYTRNRFRHHVIPLLKEEDKNVHLKFKNFSDTLFMYEEYVNKVCIEKYREVYVNNELDINKFQSLEQLIKEKILYMILENIYQDKLLLINKRHINLIFKVINSNKTNTYVNLPNGVKVVKNYNFLSFKQENEVVKYNIKLDADLLLPNNHKITYISDNLDKSNYVIRLDSSEIKLPLYVRTRKNGDKIATKNMNGHKKLSDLFTDLKINKDLRDSYPILVDSNDVILWVPGLNKSKYDKQKKEKYDIILKYD